MSPEDVLLVEHGECHGPDGGTRLRQAWLARRVPLAAFPGRHLLLLFERVMVVIAAFATAVYQEWRGFGGLHDDVFEDLQLELSRELKQSRLLLGVHLGRLTCDSTRVRFYCRGARVILVMYETRCTHLSVCTLLTHLIPAFGAKHKAACRNRTSHSFRQASASSPRQYMHVGAVFGVL